MVRRADGSSDYPDKRMDKCIRRLILPQVQRPFQSDVPGVRSEIRQSSPRPARGALLFLTRMKAAFISLALACSAVAAADDPMARLGEAEGFVSNTIIIRLRPGFEHGRLADGSVVFARQGRQLPPKRAQLRGMERSAADALANVKATTLSGAFLRAPANAALAAKHRLDRYVRVTLPATTTGDEAKTAMELMRAPSLAEIVETAELEPLGGLAAAPADPEFPKQWDMLNIGQEVAGSPGVPGADVDALAMWTITSGAPMTIALLDAGIDHHLELASRILPGWNAVTGNNDTSDVCSSHGTHVGGVIAAAGNNGFGIAGMNWEAQLLPIVVVNGCSGTETALADGLVFAADSGAKIGNLSLQYYTGSSVLQDAVGYAVDSGMLLVAATGNFKTQVAYPAKWNKCLAVAATTNKDLRWANSNPGPQVDVAAPGADVWSLIGEVSYGSKSGTSMATPHVSGLASLVWSINPSLTPTGVRTIIEATVEDVEAPGFDELTGLGRVNAFKAVQLALESLPVPSDINGDGVVDGGDLGLLLGAWDTSNPAADLDRSGVVDGADLGLLLANWS